MKDKIKIIFWLAFLILIIVGLVLQMKSPSTIKLKNYLLYLELFLGFMLAFSKLASIYLKKTNESASIKLNDSSYWFLILMLITIIVSDFII